MKNTETICICLGDIFYADFGHRPGSRMHGVRPAMVVQNDIGNLHAPTTIVAALTTEIKKIYQPTHVVVCASFGLSKQSVLMLEHLFKINKHTVLSYVGTASKGVVDRVDKALVVSVGIHFTIGYSNRTLVLDILDVLGASCHNIPRRNILCIFTIIYC